MDTEANIRNSKTTAFKVPSWLEREGEKEVKKDMRFCQFGF